MIQPIKFMRMNSRHQQIWLCRCECGNTSLKLLFNIKNGHTTSCGCRKVHRGTKNGMFSHGKCRTVEYEAYCHAKARCENKKTCNYDNYGGRGIKFKFTSFQEFWNELGLRPSSRHSLDRIDNDGHYEPGNVRWATTSEQAWNRRRRNG